MAQNFLTCDRDQPLLLPPDLRDWLPDDHLAWFVIEAIDELDLESFYAGYGIERRCREDVAFRVICATRPPTTRRSPASGSATRRPSPTCSARCWGSAPKRGW